MIINFLNNLLLQQFNKNNYIKILEPYTRTTNGLHKPDILIYKLKVDSVYIIYTHISTDTIVTDANYI